MTHCKSLKLACRPDCMAGNATVTIVTSNNNMKVAAHTTTKVHHFFSMTCSLRCESGERHRFVDICMLSTLYYDVMHAIRQG